MIITFAANPKSASREVGLCKAAMQSIYKNKRETSNQHFKRHLSFFQYFLYLKPRHFLNVAGINHFITENINFHHLLYSLSIYKLGPYYWNRFSRCVNLNLLSKCSMSSTLKLNFFQYENTFDNFIIACSDWIGM